MTAKIIPFPSPQVQLIEKTGYPKWAPLRIGGVTHRICFVWTENRRVYLESMCGRYGTPSGPVDDDRLCMNCTRRGWSPMYDEMIRGTA